jgi:hypothetical protein
VEAMGRAPFPPPPRPLPQSLQGLFSEKVGAMAQTFSDILQLGGGVGGEQGP